MPITASSFPGRCVSIGPESISPDIPAARWIPGLRLSVQNSFAILSRRRIPE
jgi:hypothetical protein